MSDTKRWNATRQRMLTLGGFTVVILLVISLGSVLVANPQWGRRSRDWRQVGREGIPSWEVEKKFSKDVFTFVRIKYDSSGYRRGGGWSTDFRDSELNFSLRLQQLTTIKVNP
jgi:hypothetical protein